MKRTLILLLFLWDSAEFTLAHAECLQLPTLDHAFVLDEYKKPQYQAGDVIYFSCDPGYITGVNSTYVCTEQGWRQATYSPCIVEGTFPVRLACARPPALENGHLVKQSAYVYTDGQMVKYQCDHLYRLDGRPHKTCSNGQWTGDLQCLASFCVAPLIDNGALEEDKEKYGLNEVLSYSCNPGYRRGNGTSVCVRMDSGAVQWSPMPQCEVITCKLSAEGTTYQIILRPGQTVTVSCGEKQWVKSKELRSAELTCQDTGRWDYDPVCQMVTCSRDAENVYDWQRNYYRLNTVYMDQTLRYRCHSGYEATSPTAKCTRRGWEPNPLCKERRCTKPSYKNAVIRPDQPQYDKYEHYARVIFICTYEPSVTFYVYCIFEEWRGSRPTCIEQPCRDQPQIENGEMVDQKKPVYYHGVSVRFICIGETDPFRVTCDLGRWKKEKSCKAVACTRPNIPNGEIVGRAKSRYDHGENVRIRCTTGLRPTVTVSCQSEEWIPENPCSGCTLNDFRQSSLFDENFDLSNLKHSYDGGERVRVPCKVGYRGFYKIICASDGQWHSTSEKCRGTMYRPTTNRKWRDLKKAVYYHGDSVRFRCIGEFAPFRVTCDLGRWKKEKSCKAVACTRPNIPNGEIDGRAKSRYDHGETVRIRCTTGLRPTVTVSCQSGDWIPENPCPEQSKCEGADIPNGFSHEHENKLYYSCNDGFKLVTKGWWGEAPCVRGEWKTSECVVSSDCGPVPDIPHLIVESEIPRFSHGDTFLIQCKTGHQNLHSNLTDLTCTEGRWTSNDVPYNHICTPIANKCSPPPKILNALIMAPFEKEYLSGTRLTYQCRENYIMEGDGTVQCNNGTWERKNLRCQRRDGRN